MSRWTRTKKQIVYDKADGKCAHCGQPLKLSNYTIDHVWPKSYRGADRYANLMPLCESCNKKKSNEIVNILNYYNYASGQSKVESLIYFQLAKKKWDKKKRKKLAALNSQITEAKGEKV